MPKADAISGRFTSPCHNSLIVNEFSCSSPDLSALTYRGVAPKIPRLIKEILNVTLEELYALIGPDMKAVDAVIRDRLYSDVVLVRQVDRKSVV